MRGISAAIRMMAERGYVVIGFPPKCCDVEQGDTVRTFAQQPIDGYVLIVTKPTDRADWDAQVKAISEFDPTVCNPPRQRGDRYLRCTLMPDVPLRSPEPRQVPKDGPQA